MSLKEFVKTLSSVPKLIVLDIGKTNAESTLCGRSIDASD